MNLEAILAVLPSSKDDAKSLKEIANEMRLDITGLCRLDPRREAAIKLFEGFSKMGVVALESRRREDGHKFWYNAYWKTDPANGNDCVGAGAGE